MYIRTCTYVHVHTYVHTYVYMLHSTCKCTYVYVHITCICTYVCTFTYVHICMYVYMYICMSIHICTYVYTYVHVYICMWPCASHAYFCNIFAGAMACKSTEEDPSLRCINISSLCFLIDVTQPYNNELIKNNYGRSWMNITCISISASRWYTSLQFNASLTVIHLVKEEKTLLKWFILCVKPVWGH